MNFKLYPDCKLVSGKSRDAIYDLTRNSIYVVPHEMSKQFSIDNSVNVDSFPKDKRREYVDFLKNNELGRFDMPKEFTALSDDFISPSLISNAIIDIGETVLPLSKIATELSDLVCESVFLRFINKVSINHIDDCSKNFASKSMSSIELGLQYENGMEDYVIDIISRIQLCSRIIIVNSPFVKSDESHRGVPIRYVEDDYRCCSDKVYDYSFFANANLSLYLESLSNNNCLNKKIVIDQYGYIKNCPRLTKNFGNVNDVSLSEVLQNSDFKKLWKMNKDNVEKCCDCELRYACQHCIYSSELCSYNVYNNQL